jgi:hypothetical protein
MKQSDLAAALSLSPAAVSRLVARGMPTGSADAARAWRRNHVRARMRPVPQGDPSAADAERLLHRVTALATAAGKALRAGDGFAAIEPELRAALGALSDTLRERVLIELPSPDAESVDNDRAPLKATPHARVPLAVMDALTADVWSVLSAGQTVSMGGDIQADAEDPAEMGRFWLRVAAGEVKASGRGAR